MNVFALSVIILFIGAALFELARGFWVKGLFYLLSALINVVVLFMR